MTNRLTILALSAALAANAAYSQTPAPAASPVVPAIPGANPALMNLPPQGQVVRPPNAPPLPADATPAPVQQPAAVATAPAAAPQRSFAAKAPSKAAQVPRSDQIADLEKRLAIARSQRRAAAVIEAGTVRGERAAHVRGKQVFPFTDKTIYEVNTTPDRMTTIELQPGERITTKEGLPRAADTVNWVISTIESGDGANAYVSVLVKPIYPNLETNMVIPTNRRNYYINMRTDSTAYMAIVGFTYPMDEANAAQARARDEAALDARKEPVALAPEQLRFGYSVAGSAVPWKPVRVFDDGSKTYIQMAPTMKSSEAPALFVIEEGEEPMLVNYRVKGDYYIVDRLFAKAQLRVGTRNAVDITRGSEHADNNSTSWWSRTFGGGVQPAER